MEKNTLTLAFERSTKNFHIYSEKGQPPIYVPVSMLGQNPPQKIEVAVTPVQ